jgi:hypothetical protein
MNKFKRVIAQEGLIILGWPMLMILAIMIGNDKLIIFAYVSYPLYLIIRFVIWAIKTLNTKQ